MKKVVFVDRDGTIIREPADKQIDSLQKLEFIPGIISGLRLLADSGFALVMVSNQDGLGTRSYPRKSFEEVQKKIIGLLRGEGIEFEKIFICPHHANVGCDCRKPKTGLVDGYVKKNKIDKGNSFVLGDRDADVEFAINLCVRSVRIGAGKIKSKPEYQTPDAYQACAYIAASARNATIERKSNETEISVTVAVDGKGVYDISTGIEFFDHMLAQLARHSRMDITIRAKGDLGIDEHHTVEDTGIVFGNALRQALGDKRGIDRFAFAAPLDEALASVVIDLSGRRHLSFDCAFKREYIGELPTELIEDFFKGFADGLGATIHISCKGRNEHHKAEAIFKAVALALRSAARIDSRTRSLLPTTKGTL
ncbi:MAG: bifunctional histidinol-phosphatase/imidazoleglycerol-phosphate dehydratase HisB [Bacteroidota bacterium]